MTPARKAATAHIYEVVQAMDPSGTNLKRYQDFLDPMSDAEFDRFMQDLKNGITQLAIYTPNMQLPLKLDNLFVAADKAGLELFERLWLTDETTGKRYLTTHKYPILRLPIRRTRQFLKHKISVGESDHRIDALTGQVIKPDRASAMSQVEIQILYSHGLTTTIKELMKVRGGDVNAYLNMKRQIEETGAGSFNQLEDNTIARSAMITHVLLKGMLLDNNIVE